MADDKKISLALPGEWALQKVFGPALTELGEDIKKLYAKGRDKIISTAYRKVKNPDDGKQANLRVTRDVLWNGAFTDDEVCAEYFGGILASSRTEDGREDDAIQYVDVIKSLSAKQLRLHYVIYNTLNKLLVTGGKPVNIGLESAIGAISVWFSGMELTDHLKLKTIPDLNILFRQSLLLRYETNHHKVDEQRILPYAKVVPSTFGVLLYSAAHNKLDAWQRFDRENFGDFPDIPLPVNYGTKIDELLAKAGVAPPPPP